MFGRGAPAAHPAPSRSALQLEVDAESIAAAVRERLAEQASAAERARAAQVMKLCGEVEQDLEEQRLAATCLGRCWLCLVRCLGRPEDFSGSLRFPQRERRREAVLLPLYADDG